MTRVKRTHTKGLRPPGDGSGASLLTLSPTAFWQALKREPWSFWFLCTYFFVEYVRPQSIHPALDVLPWGRATLALTILAFVLEGFKLRKLHLLDGLMAAFTGAWMLSIVFAVNPEWSLEGAYLFINWLVLYFFVTNIVTTRRRFFIFLVFFLLWSLKLSQHGARLWVTSGFSVPSWGARGPQGWFENPGELGIQMAIFFPIALLFAVAVRGHVKKWVFWGLVALLPATAAITILVTNARGSQLALVAVIFMVVAQSRHRVRGLVGAALALALLWAVVPDAQRERFDTMGEDETSEARMYYWDHGMRITNEYPTFGIGYRNWLPYYNSRHDLLDEVPPGIPSGELPHNVFLEASAEMGYTGLFALLALMAGTFVLNRRTRRLARRVPEWSPFLRSISFGLDAALVGFMISGFFVTVLYYPYLWTNLAFTAALFQITKTSTVQATRTKGRPLDQAVRPVSHEVSPALPRHASRPARRRIPHAQPFRPR